MNIAAANPSLAVKESVMKWTATFASVLVLASSLAAEETDAQKPRLPEGDSGIAAKYPGDAGIEKDPNVVFTESFEAGNIAAVQKRWTLAHDTKGHKLAGDVARASAGKRCYEMTGILDKQPGGYLFQVFKDGLDEAYLRFYTKFASDFGYEHHFVALSGYNPSTQWPNPKAGTCPGGADRVQIFIDPVGWYGKYAPPGVWNLYSYWCEMKKSGDGKYWGNCLQPARPEVIRRNEWICLELMIKLNDPARRDGQLALWVDGKPYINVRKGSPRASWSGMGFKLLESGGTPFEGLRLRTSPKLKINNLWLEHYVDMGAQKQNKVAEPQMVNTVWFDDIVVAKKYIGPIKKKE